MASDSAPGWEKQRAIGSARSMTRETQRLGGRWRPGAAHYVRSARDLGGRARSGVLFLMGLLVFGSGVLSLRIEVAGLYVHPQLLLVLPVAAWVLMSSSRNAAASLAPSALVTIATFSISHLVSGGPYGQLLKLIASALTLFVAASLARTSADFRAGALGLAAGVGLLAMRGMVGIQEVQLGVGLNPVEEVANKNYFSLLALPAIFVSGAWLLHGRPAWTDRVVLVLAVAACSLTIAGSANRSGWVSLAVVPILLFGRKASPRFLIGIATVAFVVMYGLEKLELLPVVEERIALTQAGYSSDELREQLYQAGAEIFLASPIYGSGLPRISDELAARVGGAFSEEIGPHSVVVYLLAGGGLFCTIPIVVFALRVVWPRFRRYELGSIRPRDEGLAWLLPRLGLLWLIRGLFSDEILYSPAFSMALGIFHGVTVWDSSFGGVKAVERRQSVGGMR